MLGYIWLPLRRTVAEREQCAAPEPRWSHNEPLQRRKFKEVLWGRRLGNTLFFFQDRSGQSAAATFITAGC